MPFQKAQPETPTTIARMDLKAMVTDITPDSPTRTYTVTYRVFVYDQNGNPMDISNQSGDLVPYLTTQQITQLKAIADSLLDKAKTEILGG